MNPLILFEKYNSSSYLPRIIRFKESRWQLLVEAKLNCDYIQNEQNVKDGISEKEQKTPDGLIPQEF